MIHRRSGAAAVALLLCTGCDSIMSAVDPAGPQSARIADLTWFLVAAGSVVYLAVMGIGGFAVWRASRRAEVAEGPEVDRKLTLWIAGGVATTALILLVLLFVNFSTGRALAAFGDPDALSVRITAQQWWWEIEYLDPVPSRRLVTANELYIPAGRRVRVETRSRDVIHSFWVPNLHGKLDVTPGYTASTFLQADSAGIYTGRCAEFCGHQHAHMSFQVVALSPDDFDRWFAAQLRPASPPAGPVEAAGEQVFHSRGCVLCHTIRGTPAGSRFGPDLTHIGSRLTLAAGTLPNDPSSMAGWILDPQAIKPGVHMPSGAVEPEELNALVAYLQGLE